MRFRDFGEKLKSARRSEESLKLYHGNCLDVLRSEIKSASIDLVVTSPPYDNLRDYKGYSFDFEPVADELKRVLRPGGVIVWIVNDATIDGSETGTSFRQALYFKSIGLNLHDTMIWFKPNAIPLTHNRYDPAFEYMFVLSRGNPEVWNGLKRESKTYGNVINRSAKKYAGEVKCAGRVRNEKTPVREYTLYKNVWELPIGCDSANNTLHTAPFPTQLAIDHIKSWSNERQVVLDPFMGFRHHRCRRFYVKQKIYRY